MITCWYFSVNIKIILLLCMFYVPVHASSRYCTEANCTCLERELEIALKDDSPQKISNWKSGPTEYFSNAHNISRALYPPKKAPAKFLWIKVKFYNTSGNVTRNDNFIWALSCLYAVLPGNLLAVLSLGTLYHERYVLEVSVPEFCDGVPGEEYMEYALLSLQDFALIPSASDYRLNTAECVFKIGSCNDSVNQLIYTRDINYGISVSQIIFSLIGCFIFGTLLKKWRETVEKENKGQELSRVSPFTFTAIAIIVLNFVLQCLVVGFGVVYFISCCSKGTTCDGHIIFLFVLAFLQIILIVIILLHLLYKLKENQMSWCLCYPLCYGICYHFLWVILGVFANPVWGFSVLLSVCSFFLLVYILAYYFGKMDTKQDKYFACLVGFSVMAMFLSLIAFCLMSVRFLLINDTISSLIQAALTAVIGLILSLLSYFIPSFLDNKKKKTSKEKSPEEKMELTNNVG